MRIQKARKRSAALLEIRNSRPFLLFLREAETASTKASRECINFAIRPRYAPRRSRVYRCISSRTALETTEPHTGERGRVAPRHRFAGYIIAAAPVSRRSVPPAAPAASHDPDSGSGPAAAPRLSPTPPPFGRLSPGPAPPSPDVRSAPRSAPAPPLGTHLLSGIRGASPLRPGRLRPAVPATSLPPARRSSPPV